MQPAVNNWFAQTSVFYLDLQKMEQKTLFYENFGQIFEPSCQIRS
jgi:hypothetical protein